MGRVSLSLALVSAAGLAYEIALTRLFSFLFQYHYAFLAVSLAVLGIGLGAAVGYGLMARCTPGSPAAVLPGLSLSFFLVAGLLLAWPWAGSVWPLALVGLVPFTGVGFFLALVFSRYPSQSGRLYGADLAGAALGLAGALILLQWSGPEGLLFLLGAVLAIAALLFPRPSSIHPAPRSLPLTAAMLAVAGLAVGLAHVTRGGPALDPARLMGAPRDKTLVTVLQDERLDAHVVYTAWSPFARVDVVEQRDPAIKFVFTDGGAGSAMIRFDGHLEAVAFLQEEPAFIPLAVVPPGHTLVVGAGAGKDVLMALLAGATSITALEVNPAVVTATRHFAAFNGHILDHPDVSLVVGDARTFAQRSRQAFDLIYLNLVYTQAADPAGQALVENYVFTRQAFQTYLERLTPDGYLAVVSHNALEGSRAALTALAALDWMGVPPARALDHLALWMVPAADPTLRTSVLLVGREPLPPAVLAALTDEARRRQMQPLFAPGTYEMAFAPLRQGMELDQFIQADAPYDLGPTVDDRPFFFKLEPGLPLPIRQLLGVAGGFACTLLLAGLWLLRRSGRGMDSLTGAALLGAGVMLVEIPSIQRFQLLLGQPILSLAVVLGTLLVAGGLGSGLSQRWHAGRLRAGMVAAALGCVAGGLLAGGLLPALVQAALNGPLALRLGVAILFTAPLGLAMGIPFPTLLRLASREDRGDAAHVALLWGVNGAFSVTGSAVAVALAMTWGFGSALAAGAGLYAALALLAWRGLKSPA